MRAIGRQAGINIALPVRSVAHRRTSAVRGTMEPAAALAHVASSANLIVKFAAPGTYILLPIAARPSASRAMAAKRFVRAPVVGPVSKTSVEVVPEIVVTGSKRETPPLRFAGLWTRIAGRQLDGWGPAGSEAIEARVAGFSSTHLGAGRNKLFIRGIADSSFSGPTQSPVAQYFGDLRTSYSGPDPDLRLVDTNSIEVLEGPQGTLYGAGAIGGVFAVTPNSPQIGENSGVMAVGGSATQHGAFGNDVSLVLNVAAGQTSALRLVGYRIRDGGYLDNITTGEEDTNRISTTGVRLAGRTTIGPGWTVEVSGALQRIQGKDSQYADRNAPPLSRLNDGKLPFRSEFSMGSMTVTKNFGTVKLRSVTGLTDQHVSENFDAASPIWKRFSQSTDGHAFSNETRVWRPMRDGFSWLVGLSLLEHRYDVARSVSNEVATADLAGVSNQRSEQTLFAEVGAKLFGSVELDAGGRLTRSALTGWGRHLMPVSAADERSRGQARRVEERFSPSVSLLARPRDRMAVYARLQGGFRPGGMAVADDVVHYFRHDQLLSAEVGVRYGTPRQDHFDLQAALTSSRWSDIQADYIDSRGLPSTSNIGDGRVRTLTLNLGGQPVDGVRTEVGVAWNDGKITRADPAFARLAGLLSTPDTMRIPNIARLVARGSLEWTHRLDSGKSFSASTYLRYVGHSRLGIGPTLGRSQGDYVDSGASIRASDSLRTLSISITNLTDAVGNRFALGTPLGGTLDQVTPLHPRSIRLGFETRF